nr:putative membrane protein [Takachi virus]BCU46461.1 putative membrane protein [Takachi virus]BCU46467.1 putative membrane protein [Takachi virus]BCU46473.1 putative membrane protein [Takachi virus]BCU46479.1 putative membrane protein [Takachi virus]
MEVSRDYLDRLARRAVVMGEGYEVILDEARELFPTSKEFALPDMLRKYLERREVPLDTAFFLDVLLPLVAVGLAITTCRWTRMALAIVVYLTGYYYTSILLATTAVVSLAFALFRPPAPERRDVVIENGRLSVVGLTAVAVVATAGLSYYQPGPVTIFMAASIAGFLAILMAIPTIQYHGAPDVAKMLLTVLLFGGVLYLVSAMDVDRDQIYLLMKTGTPTYHIPKRERRGAVMLDQVYEMARYYSRYPRALRARFTDEEGIWAWDAHGEAPPEGADYTITVLHAILFSLAVYTLLTDTGETDRVLGDIKMRLLEKIKTTELFGETTLARISMAMSRVEWLVVIAANLVHTHWTLGFPGVAVEILLCGAVAVPTYHLWKTTVGLMAMLKGTNAFRQTNMDTLPAPTIRTATSSYMSGLATILGLGALCLNLYYYLVGNSPYFIAVSVLAFSASIVMVQSTEMLMGYKPLLVLSYTLNTPALLLLGAVYRRYQGKSMWSRIT